VRVLVALGGNAMTGPDGSTTPEAQISAIRTAMRSVADLIVEGIDVVLTHGNGPQVGNLLVTNEMAAKVVPPVPLDWCGAETQGTLGFILVNTLEHELATRGSFRPTAALITRTRVDPGDAGFQHPSKPIGRYIARADAEALMAHGQTFQDRGDKGWRRVVPSPEPVEILEADVVETLVQAGYVVVANGGGGIPVVRDDDGSWRGVEAVIDKDLGAAMLAEALHADRLVIATDVEAAELRYGEPDAEPIGEVEVGTLRGYAAAGHFTSGSMGPKVEAVCRFVERVGKPAVITRLDNIVWGVRGECGTVVVPDCGQNSGSSATR
jgi:carbamate kinase